MQSDGGKQSEITQNPTVSPYGSSILSEAHIEEQSAANWMRSKAEKKVQQTYSINII